MRYDVLIVGLGPAGIACAKDIKERNPNARVVVVDQGLPIKQRRCPAQENKTGCINCTVCSIMSGTGGAGANSDGKFTMPQKSGLYHIGGSLPNYITLEETNKLILEQHQNNCAKGAPNNIISKTNTEFVRDFDSALKKVGLYRADAAVNHIGTTAIRKLYNAYEEELISMSVELLFRTQVVDLIISGNKTVGVILKNGRKIFAKHVVIASGRSGSKWMEEMCKKHHIYLDTEQIDIGFRVEVLTKYMEAVNQNFYEAKIIGKYGDVMVRMFCTNPNGEVVTETAENLKYVNGHSDDKPISMNTNFALLATYNLAMDQPSQMVRALASVINALGNNQPVVQRYEDVLKNRPTTPEALARNTVIPTLRSALPGDMTGVFPEKALSAIKQYVTDLSKVIPGIDNPDTLFYGLEAKFCHSGIHLNNELMCNIGAYIIGDASITHGLASAAASGIYVARCIYPKDN